MDRDQRVTEYGAAVDAFARAAEAVPPERWEEPLAAGKWSPAGVTLHVTLAYEALLTEVRGGGAMAVRTKWWQRLFLRIIVLPRFLKGVVPKGAPAPRETRPDRVAGGEASLPPELAIARLRKTSAEFLQAVLDARDARPGLRLTHPYFGGIGLDDVITFTAVHTRHHCAQLEAIEAGPATASDRSPGS